MSAVDGVERAAKKRDAARMMFGCSVALRLRCGQRGS